MSLPQREFGKTGLKVPAIGLGCMTMSPAYDMNVNDEDGIKTLKKAIELGCTFWDTADIYGRGHNEQLISKVLKEHRSEIFLGTKFGFVFNIEAGAVEIHGEREYIKSACAKSLERLGTDYVDLYYAHRIDAKTPIEETIGAMAELVKEGKVRHLGLSECSAETLRRAHKVHPISAVQVEYSPWTIDIETNGILEACKELGIAVVAYSPLGRGFLTGELKSPDDLPQGDWRRNNPRFQGDAFYKNLEIVREIEKVASKKGVTPGQLALAWVLAQSDLIIPIPGTKREKYLIENLKAANVHLSQDELKEIREIVDKAEISGARYAPREMSLLGN